MRTRTACCRYANFDKDGFIIWSYALKRKSLKPHSFNCGIWALVVWGWASPQYWAESLFETWIVERGMKTELEPYSRYSFIHFSMAAILDFYTLYWFGVFYFKYIEFRIHKNLNFCTLYFFEVFFNENLGVDIEINLLGELFGKAAEAPHYDTINSKQVKLISSTSHSHLTRLINGMRPFCTLYCFKVFLSFI